MHYGKKKAVVAKDKMAIKSCRPDMLVKKAGALVLKSLPERLSEESLAGAFGIEVQELRYAFRHVCGVEIYKALRTLRTDEVKRRLDADANLSVETAMRQCGFGSYVYFRKEFHKKFGVDPKAFRKDFQRTQAMPTDRIVANRQRPGRRDDAQTSEPGLSLQGENSIMRQS